MEEAKFSKKKFNFEFSENFASSKKWKRQSFQKKSSTLNFLKILPLPKNGRGKVFKKKFNFEFSENFASSKKWKRQSFHKKKFNFEFSENFASSEIWKRQL